MAKTTCIYFIKKYMLTYHVVFYRCIILLGGLSYVFLLRSFGCAFFILGGLLKMDNIIKKEVFVLFYDECIKRNIHKTKDLMSKENLKKATDIIASDVIFKGFKYYNDKEIRSAFKEGKRISEETTSVNPQPIELHYVAPKRITKAKKLKSSTTKIPTIKCKYEKSATKILKKAVAICPNCETIFYANFYYSSNIIDNSKYRTITCPCCEKRISTSSDNIVIYRKDEDVDKQAIVDSFREKISKNYYLKIESIVQTTLKKYEPKKTQEPFTTIKLQKNELIKYLKHCVNIESAIHFYSSFLTCLLQEEHQNDIILKATTSILSRDIKEEKKQDETAYSDALSNLEFQFEVNKEKINSSEFDCKIELPKAPIMPDKEVLPDAPKKPVLKQLTFFRKKAIIEENKKLLEKYNIELENFEREVTRINTEINVAMEKYHKEKEEYENKLNEINAKKKEYKAEQIALYQQEYTSCLIELENAKPKSDKYYAEKEQKLLKQCAAAKYKEFLAFEIKRIKAEIKQCVKARSALYSVGIVYPKYQSYIPISTICEYFESGRCDNLEGANGAYNLFEEEVRSNEIICQLVNINNSLEQIKANQFLLYTELVQINDNLKSIQNLLYDISNFLDSISDKLDTSFESFSECLSNISSNTGAIVTNTAIGASGSILSAYYSKINAQYAAKNAELTDALGYLVAFK